MTWSADKTTTTQKYFSRFLSHFILDIAIGVPVGAARIRRQIAPSSAVILVNVTNISSSALVDTMRNRLANLSATSFPGFILAERLGVSAFAVASSRVVNTTVSKNRSESSTGTDTLSVTIIVTAVIAALS